MANGMYWKTRAVSLPKPVCPLLQPCSFYSDMRWLEIPVNKVIQGWALLGITQFTGDGQFNFMKKLFLIILLSTTLLAQAQAPDAVYLTDAQSKRLNDTQARIELLSAQLDAAKKAQEIELLKIQLELGATLDKFESTPTAIDGKYGFKKKLEKKTAEVKP